MTTTTWMTCRELADHLNVTRTTVKNRHKNKTIFDGLQVERRDATPEETKGGRLKHLFRTAPATRVQGSVEKKRAELAEREKDADARYHKLQREKAEAALEELRVEYRALEQKLADEHEAMLETQRARNAAMAAAEAYRNELEGGQVPSHVRTLVDAVWTALGEDEVCDMRDGLLVALREYTEAR